MYLSCARGPGPSSITPTTATSSHSAGRCPGPPAFRPPAAGPSSGRSRRSGHSPWGSPEPDSSCGSPSGAATPARSLLPLPDGLVDEPGCLRGVGLGTDLLVHEVVESGPQVGQ